MKACADGAFRRSEVSSRISTSGCSAVESAGLRPALSCSAFVKAAFSVLTMLPVAVAAGLTTTTTRAAGSTSASPASAPSSPATGRCHVARSVPVRPEPSSTRAAREVDDRLVGRRRPERRAARRQRAEAQLLPRDGRAVERQRQQRRGGRPGAGRERMVGADLPVRPRRRSGPGRRAPRRRRRSHGPARRARRPCATAGRRADVARQPPRPRLQVERRLGAERMEREPRRLGQRVGRDLEVGPHLPRPERRPSPRAATTDRPA